MAAAMRPRRAPSFSMAATVASSTPPSAPFQPAWAAPITPALASANSTGAQSAVRMPSTTPGMAVTMPSPSCLAAKSQSAPTTWTLALWICARVTSLAPGRQRRHSAGAVLGHGGRIVAWSRDRN